MIGWYTRREASLPCEVSFLNTPQRWKWTLDADWLFFFYQRRHESSALPSPPPPLLYHLAVVIISADSAHSRRFPTSVACYDITAVKLQTKKYTFWDMNWNELWILLTLNRPPPPIFTSQSSPDEPPLMVTLFWMMNSPWIYLRFLPYVHLTRGWMQQSICAALKNGCCWVSAVFSITVTLLGALLLFLVLYRLSSEYKPQKEGKEPPGPKPLLLLGNLLTLDLTRPFDSLCEVENLT